MEKFNFSPRNLYIIKKTLDSFGLLQLPTNLDVLQRLLNCILVKKLESKDAYQKVLKELTDLYGEYSIPVIKENQIVDLMRDLVNEYMKIRKNLYIYNLNKKEKSSFSRREEIFDCFHREDEFVNKLGNMFQIWEDDVKDRLKDENVLKFFSAQNKPKKLNLLEDASLRYQKLINGGGL